MIVLDTDHINVLTYPQSRQGIDLAVRMRAATDEVFSTTDVTVEE
jgi:hypothetical protein